MVQLASTVDGEYTFQGTDYHLRCYLDPAGVEAPLFVLHEPNDNRGRPLPHVRVELAVHLAKQLELTPDRVNWVEQAPDGSMKTFEFRPWIQEIRDHEADLSRHDLESAERDMHLQPQRITRYNVAEHSIPRERVEGLVGEPLKVPESYADRQNRAFETLHDASKWTMPERSHSPKITPT